MGDDNKTAKVSGDRFDGTNWLSWIDRVQDYLYGKNALEIFEQSLIDPTDDDDAKANITPTIRTNTYFAIKASMGDEVAKKQSSIKPRGETEALLRALKHKYAKNTVNARSKLKKQLHSARLEDHADLDTYIAHIKSIVQKLGKTGYNVMEEDNCSTTCSKACQVTTTQSSKSSKLLENPPSPRVKSNSCWRTSLTIRVYLAVGTR